MFLLYFGLSYLLSLSCSDFSQIWTFMTYVIISSDFSNIGTFYTFLILSLLFLNFFYFSKTLFTFLCKPFFFTFLALFQIISNHFVNSFNNFWLIITLLFIVLISWVPASKNFHFSILIKFL